MSHPRLRRMRRNAKRPAAATGAEQLPAYKALFSMDHDELVELAKRHGVNPEEHRATIASQLAAIGEAARGEQ